MTEALVRLASAADASAVGRLLHDFNIEFGDPTPPPDVLAQRVTRLMTADASVLVAGSGPDGVAVLRFRPALWTDHLECYVAELYVVPQRRGQGLGRALLIAALDHARERGADYVDLNTSETDTAARRLYESLGFVNRDRPGAGMNLYYERDL